MNKTIYKKITASVAALFSFLTIVEGSQVLLGITQPDYIVFTPLLIYNVFMGVVGVIVGVMIWMNHARALRYAVIATAAHLTVLLIVWVIYVSNSTVALHSVNAMIIRSFVWMAITLVIWKTGKSKMYKKKII